MNLKNNFLICGIVLLLLTGSLFQLQVSAQEEQLTEITEISSKDFTYHGTGYEIKDGNILFNSDASKLIINQGKKNEIIIEGNSGIKISPLGKISVMESGSEFSINGNAFKNIKSGDIVFDKNTGEITNADFFTNENPGNYNINGNKFNVPANQRVIYDSKKEFELPGGTEILEIKNTQVKSSGILDYKGNKIGGALTFDEKGNILVKAKLNTVVYDKKGKVVSIELGEPTIVNGVSIRNKGDRVPSLPIFFNKNAAEASKESEYIVIDPSKNLFVFREDVKSSLGNVGIEFKKENYLFGDLMDEKDYFYIGEGGIDPGYLEITRSSKDNLPILKTQGEIEVNQDEKRFLFNNEHLIFKKGTNIWPIPEDSSSISGTIPMVLESENRIVVGLIPDNDDKNFYWRSGGKYVFGSIEGISKEQAGVELPDFITKDWIENSEVTQDRSNTISVFANNLKFQKVYKESLNIKLNKYAPDVKKFEDELSALEKSGKDPSILWNEVEKVIGQEKVNEIKSTLKNRVELHYIIYNELSKEKDLENYIDKFEVEKKLLEFMSKKELDALNKCTGRGNSFDSCFYENYKYLGEKTFKCITNPEYCKTMTSYQFAKMRIK